MSWILVENHFAPVRQKLTIKLSALASYIFLMEGQMSEIEPKLIELLHKNLRLKMPISAIHAHTPIFGKDGLGLDSVDALEIAVLLDKHFAVRLDEKDPAARAALTTIGSLVDYIRGKTGAA